jgi:hypothetical protein
MAFTTVGLIQAQIALATQSYPAGSRTLGPIAIPAGLRYGNILIDLTQTNELVATIGITVDVSFDNGVTFPFSSGGAGLSLPNSGYTISGGTLIDPNNVPVRLFWSSIRLPDPGNAARQVQATFSTDLPVIAGATVGLW